MLVSKIHNVNVTKAPVALPEVIAEAKQSGAFLVTPVRQLFDQIMKVVDIVHTKDLPRGTEVMSSAHSSSESQTQRAKK